MLSKEVLSPPGPLPLPQPHWDWFSDTVSQAQFPVWDLNPSKTSAAELVVLTAQFRNPNPNPNYNPDLTIAHLQAILYDRRAQREVLIRAPTSPQPRPKPCPSPAHPLPIPCPSPKTAPLALTLIRTLSPPI